MKAHRENWIERYYGSEHYFLWYSQNGYFENTVEEVDFIINQTIPYGKVLDVGCGHGRHSFEFAKRGFGVVGMDISQKLIYQALQNRESHVHFVLDDARKISKIKDHFNLIILLFSSFGAHSHEENCLVIREVCSQLDVGGYIVIDVDNIYEIKRYIANTGGVYTDGDFSERVIFDSKTNTVWWQEVWNHNVYNGKYQLYTRDQLSHILENAGLCIKNFFGSFKGEKYTTKSQRLIVVATKK